MVRYNVTVARRIFLEFQESQRWKISSRQTRPPRLERERERDKREQDTATLVASRALLGGSSIREVKILEVFVRANW